MTARVEPDEHSGQPDTHDGKQIVARVGGIGSTAQASAIVHTQVSEVTADKAAMQRSVNTWKIPASSPLTTPGPAWTSRVMVAFVANFVAMATEISRGRIYLTSFNSPTQKPLFGAASWHCFLYMISYSPSPFVLNFVAMAAGVIRGDLNDAVQLAVPGKQ